jgi:hypothetical protein
MTLKFKDVIRLSMVFVTLFLLSHTFFSVAQASPPAQDPRGDGNGGGSASGESSTAHGHTSNDSKAENCGSVSGQVLNWGFGPAGDVTTELKTGSWQTSTASASDGNYGYGGLGIGIATLHVSLAPAQAENLNTHLQQAAVYLNCDYPTIANIALYSGSEIEPPATLEMSAPDRFKAGRNTSIKLTVKNGLPNDITNVIVTDLMPVGLVALDVATAATAPENAKIINGGDDGQLVVVFLGTLAAGDETNIIITVTTAEDAPLNTQLSNAATLFYRESVADQASIDFTIEGDGFTEPTITLPSAEAPAMPEPESVTSASTTAPESEEAPASTTVSETENESDEAFVPPDDLPTTGDRAVPPGLLPVTGNKDRVISKAGPGILLPLSWLGVFSLVYLVYYLRSPSRRE